MAEDAAGEFEVGDGFPIEQPRKVSADYWDELVKMLPSMKFVEEVGVANDP